MSIDMTSEEMAESLTGYDEIAISQTFGAEVGDLSGNRTLRALVFVHLRRGGLKDKEAKDGALSMTLKDAVDYFAEDEDEAMPDEPVTESGKGSMSAE